MADKPSGAAPANNSSRTLVALAAILAAVAGFGAVYVNMGGTGNDAAAPEAESGKPSSGTKSGLGAYSKGHMTAFVAKAKPADLPPVEFVATDGSPKSIAEWKGKVVLLNLWATWCGPCREEMPALDRLKASLAGDDFDVVALSIDRTGLEKPKKFLQEIGVRNLELYNNSSGKLAQSLKAFGMPTTLLLDRQGRELGRLVGPAEWDSDDAVALIKAAIEGSN